VSKKKAPPSPAGEIIATHQTPSHSAKAITATTISQPIRATGAHPALPDRLYRGEKN
jgi:hypothetical protein